MSDNAHFDITGAPLAICLQIATGISSSGRVTGWRMDADKNRLILYSLPSPRATPLPAPLTGEALVLFVKAWLDQASYGVEPDHDGDNSRGFRIYNEDWGHIDHEYQAFVAIEPAWLMHGK